MSGAFDKDPVANLPYLTPDQGSVRCPGSWLQGRSYFDLPPVLRANLSIGLLRSMCKGFLTGPWRTAPPIGTSASWSAAGALPQLLSLRLLEAHRMLTPPRDRPRGAAAMHFARVAATTPPAPGAGPPVPCQTEAQAKKGDLCRAVVRDISLPSVGSRAVCMTSLSPRASAYLNNYSTRMLAEGWRAAVEASDIVPFTDPALRSRRAKQELAGRLWMAGLLTGVTEVKGTIHPFTVIKKVRGPGSYDMRLVLDQRKDNMAWKTPPWTPMASPGLFPYVQVPRDPTKEVQIMVGDLPDMYWTLALPQAMAAHFCLEGVTPADLSNHLVKAYGVNVSFGADVVALGMQVPIMGWSWAVCLAQVTLEDCLERDVAEMKSSSRLQYGVPLPRLAEMGILHWEYIDDVGAMVWAKPRPDGDPTEAKKLGEKIRAALRANGLGFHKDDYGTTAVSLGHEISPSSFGVRPTRAKLFQTAGALENMLWEEEASGQQVEAIIGSCCWLQLVIRCSLCVWRETYQFVVEERSPQVRKIPEGVLEELQAILFLLPLAVAKLDLDWHGEVFMADSCVQGAGLIKTNASTEEIIREAAFAETRGWSAEVETLSEEIEEDGDILMRLGGEVPRGPRADVVRVLHLFSGPAREMDLGWWLKVVGGASGIAVVVENVDTIISKGFNIFLDDFYRPLLSACEAGVFDIIHSGSPCSTWSRARWRRPGPPILRTRLCPYGGDPSIPEVSAKEALKRDVHTILFRRSFELCSAVACSPSQGKQGTENPADPGAPYPSIFATSEAEEVRRKTSAEDVVFHQCRFGLEFVKPTQVMSNVPAMKKLALLCDHPRGAHQEMKGQLPDGTYVTAAQSRYPSELCEALARAYLDGVESTKEAKKEREDGEAEALIQRWIVKPVPAVGRQWDPLERWSEVTRLKWKIEDHNNLGKVRILVLALRRLARSQKSWDKRVLVISDSMVAIGALAKGRSPSWPILRLCRMAAAVQLATGIRPYWRWIQSKRNHADGPSRDFPLGVAPDWVSEADREELRRRIAEAGARKRAEAEQQQRRELMDTGDVNMDFFLTAG